MRDTPEQQARQSAGQVEVAETAEARAAALDMERRQLTGIGGWLIFFLVLLAFTLINSLFGLLMSIPMLPPEVERLITWRSVVSLVLGLIILGLLLARNPAFPKIVRIYLLAEIALAAAFTYLMHEAVGNAMPGEESLLESLLLSLGVTTAVCLAWFVYFGRSIRVRLTFRRRAR